MCNSPVIPIPGFSIGPLTVRGKVQPDLIQLGLQGSVFCSASF